MCANPSRPAPIQKTLIHLATAQRTVDLWLLDSGVSCREAILLRTIRELLEEAIDEIMLTLHDPPLEIRFDGSVH